MLLLGTWGMAWKGNLSKITQHESTSLAQILRWEVTWGEYSGIFCFLWEMGIARVLEPCQNWWGFMEVFGYCNCWSQEVGRRRAQYVALSSKIFSLCFFGKTKLYTCVSVLFCICTFNTSSNCPSWVFATGALVHRKLCRGVEAKGG